MGKRAFLIKQEVLAQIFAYRGPGWGAVVRMGGEHLPDDARLNGMMFIPPQNAWALVYESATWSELVLPGQRVNNVNGVPIVDNATVCWLFLVPFADQIPGCHIPGVDPEPVAQSPELEKGSEPCATNDG